MQLSDSPGARFRAAIEQERPLQVVGAINGYAARLAERGGFRALYLSGGGVSAASCGLPDLGVITVDDILTDLRRITAVTDLPVLVDIDTGFGNVLGVDRTVRSMQRAGAAAVHIEDQAAAKRCGHRQGKSLVDRAEMSERIAAAVRARTDPDFVIMARTDALAVEGTDSAISRARDYVAAGADMVFPEAVTELSQYRRFVEETGVPVLANLTEFGKTPLWPHEALTEAGVAIALYPLSAFRAMGLAAERVYRTIRDDGSQKNAIGTMQTREALYEVLDYQHYERLIDEGLDSEES
ncbi:MAG: methylisocitrate lyase [Pseudomonadota bacterium]|nr:methylisocitrate lyase [Pseudomonadota bacterium]